MKSFIKLSIVTAALALVALALHLDSADAQRTGAPRPPATATGPAATSPTTGTATRPAAVSRQTMLKNVPEDCVGFVSADSMEAAWSGMKAFYREIISPIAPAEYLTELDSGAGPLDEMRRNAPGVDIKGPAMAIMLDPAKFTKPAGQQTIFDVAGEPFVLFIPTKNPKELFKNSGEIKQDGDIIELRNAEGEQPPNAWCAMALDGFTAVALDKRVLQSLPARRSILDVLSPADAKIIQSNQISGYVNYKKAAKMLDKVTMEHLSSVVPFFYGGFHWSYLFAAGPVGPAGAYLYVTRGEIFRDASSYAFGVNLDKNGVDFQVRAGYAPDSAIGKMLATYKATGKGNLDRLPDLPYIFAYGSTKDFKTPVELKKKQWKELMDTEALKSVPGEVKNKALNAILAVHDQVTSVQHYAGPATDTGKGFTVTTVIECESADKLMASMKDIASAGDDFLRNLPDMDEPFKQLSVRYMENVLKIDDQPVHAIDLSHPKLAELGEIERAYMKTILGDDKIRLLITPVDKKTVVTVFGGGDECVKMAVKAAKEGKCKIASGDQAKKTLAKGPKDGNIVVMIDPGAAFNLYTTMIQELGVGAMLGGPGGQLPKATPAEPWGGFLCVDKTGWTFSGTIPTSSIRELARAAKAMSGGF